MKKIPGLENYYATKDGEIWSSKRGKLKKMSIKTKNKKGYLHVILRKNGKSITKTLHTLILTTFSGIRPEGLQCRHLDGNKLNNNLSNLVWGTASENQQDAVKHGTHKSLSGEKHPNAKLTGFLVRMIRYWYNTKMVSQTELAKLFDISRPTINRIVTNNYWRTINV